MLTEGSSVSRNDTWFMMITRPRWSFQSFSPSSILHGQRILDRNATTQITTPRTILAESGNSETAWSK